MKKLLCAVTCMTVITSSFTAGVTPISAQAAGEGQARQVEFLNRGLIASKVDNGVFLSWRLLGTESMDQRFDIYKNGELVKSDLDATNYVDNEGFSYDRYQVVPAGTASEDVNKNCVETEVWIQKDGNITYYDIPLNKPAAGTAHDGSSYTYSVNDTSVADLDGDGEYEYIIKWEPSNAQDSSIRGYTGRVLIDAYKFDGTQLWRIDLGQNIRAGAHYTQFMVYDFDGDGRAEMAVKTAPGTKDGQSNYVNEVNFSGTYDDNNKNYVTTKSGKSLGMILTGEEYLTMFEGETGRALKTIDYEPERGSIKDWGDSYGNRSERYLAAVAYLNGTTPSLVMCRGYYDRAAMTAYDWDGTNFVRLWARDDKSGGIKAQGNHNLSVCDADNDGKDEIVYGSAVVDDNGSVLHSTGHGHGDALHVSDFNNDGQQEIFQVHENPTTAQKYGAEFRNAKTGSIIGTFGAKADVGRGCMDNVDDTYAASYAKAPSMFWCSASANVFDINGNPITKTIIADGQETTVDVSAPGDTNFLVYWDGDLSRELLDRNRIDKFTVENGTDRLVTFSNIHSNNGSKATPALCADILGDWREEVLFGTADDTALRIYTTTDETEYKLTTLMHDTQYRVSVAWQNVGYNQPTHLSYYVGTSALAKDKNYLAPNTEFDMVYTAHEVALNTERESDEKLLYTANSFNSGFSGGFSNSLVTSQQAPYNNVIRTNGTAMLDLRYLFDADATPAPTPEPTPTPTPTPTPRPTATPVYENDFSDSSVGTIMSILTTEQEPYKELPGMEIYIGTRKNGADTTTYAAISSAGNPANCLQFQSGKFANNNRGARVKLLTPEYDENHEIIALIDFKTEEDNALYYGDDATVQGTKSLWNKGDNVWHTLEIVVSDSGRRFYVDDEEVAKDSSTELPVLWGAGAESYTSVYFDNYSARVEEKSDDPTPTPTATQAPDGEAEVVYENDFSDVSVGTIMSVLTTDQDPYKELPGMEIYIGTRKDGVDTTTNAGITDNGNPGNALQLSSGRFASNNRGPRVKLITPDSAENKIISASIDFMVQSGNSLYYGDDTANQCKKAILAEGDDIWHTLKIVISGGKRTLYVDEQELASDDITELPVLWGTDVNDTYSLILFDNYLVTVEERDEPSPSPTVVPERGVRIVAEYNADGTLKSINEIEEDVEISDETPGRFTKVFYWNNMNDMEPLAMYEGDFSIQRTANEFTVAESEIHDKLGTYKISFDWKPGSTVQLRDETGADIVTLSKSGSGSMTYKAGTGTEKTIHASLTSSASWYHIELTIDFTAKNMDISVTDYTNNMPEKSVYAVPFTGVNGYLAEMYVSSGALLDNVRLSEISYNVPMTLFNINVSDSSGDAIEGASAKIGSKTLETDSTGHAAIKLKSDTYAYSITKPEYKSESGTVTADSGTEDIGVTLADGETRNIYVTYKFGDVVIKQSSESVAQAKENTKYTVNDSIKTEDITYTFTSDADEITPGYEEYMGKTYTFEYDADQSSTVDIIVGEDADTYITLMYKIKRVPTAYDNELLDINFGEDGFGKENWSATSFDYAVDETYGVKYAQFTGLNKNNIVVNIPQYTSDNLVIEFDISFRELSYGGNYYGVTPYSGSTAGQAFGLRTSKPENTQWQWCYRSGNDVYMQNAVDGKEYSYSYNWQNRWAHVVMVAVPSENKFNVSVVNRDSGVVYLQDSPLPFANGVGGSGAHVTKLVFGNGGYGVMSSNDVIGLANLKAYTIGAETGTIEESTIDIHDGMSVDLASNYHASDYAGLDYSVEGAFNVTYSLESEDGTSVTEDGITLSDEGVLTIDRGVDLQSLPQYYVSVKYSGVTVKKIKLHYLESVLVYGTIKGFDSGETSPFTLTNKSGYTITNSNGAMKYTRQQSTGLDRNVWLNAAVWSEKLADNFVFSYDMMIEDSFYKGYMYLQDGSGSNMLKCETRFDEPRMKFFAPYTNSSETPSFSSDKFKKGEWYTLVFRGTGFESSDKKVTLEIYNRGDYNYSTDTATGSTIIDPIEFIPDSSCSNNGLVLKFQTAHGSGKQTTDNGDAQYFDNLAYYYYEYR